MATQEPIQMRYGMITDESLQVYHSTDAVSKTKLDTFRKHPDLYRKIYVSHEMARPDPTPAMILGQQAGCFIMEGISAFNERYYVIPDGVGKQKTEHKAIRERLKAENTGKEQIDFDAFQTIVSMNRALRRNPQFNILVENGIPEVTFRIQGENFSVQVRPDWWNEKGCSLTGGAPYIVDLKTIAELPQDDPGHLGRHIADYGYQRSAFMYPRITALALGWSPDTPPPRFFLAFIEKDEPFHSEIVELGELDVEIGERQVVDAFHKLNKCMKTGIWQDQRTEIRKVFLPSYYIRQALETTESFLSP